MKPPRGGLRVASLPGTQQRQVNAADGPGGLRTHLQGQGRRPRQAHSPREPHARQDARLCPSQPLGTKRVASAPAWPTRTCCEGRWPSGRSHVQPPGLRGPGPIPCDVCGPGCPGGDCVLPGGRLQGLPQSPDAAADLPGRGHAWGKNLVTGVLLSPLGLPVRQGPQAPGPWRSLAAAHYLGHRAQGPLQEGPATVQDGSDVPRSLRHRAGRRPL